MLAKKTKRLFAYVSAAVLGGAAYAGVTLSSSVSTVNLPYRDNNNVVISSACTATDPEYLVHAGGANITMYPGTDNFTVTSTSTPGLDWNAPYVTAGYNNSTNSNACNTDAKGKYASYALPVKIGSQGNPVTSIHTVTQGYFYGDTGYDLWFTPSPLDDTYADMSGDGPFAAATEIMVWTSNTHLVTRNVNLADYPVVIDGQHWLVQVGLASQGHGKSTETPKGWNVVNFIAPNQHVGNVTMSNLALDPFVSYSIAHGYVPASYYWEGVNAGMEITDGTGSLAGFSLTGMK